MQMNNSYQVKFMIIYLEENVEYFTFAYIKCTYYKFYSRIQSFSTEIVCFYNKKIKIPFSLNFRRVFQVLSWICSLKRYLTC